MSTDGIQNFSGDAELIDGVLRDNCFENGRYRNSVIISLIKD